MTSASRSSGVTTYLGLLLLLLQVVLSGCGDNSRGVESVSASTATVDSRAEVTNKAVVDGTGEVYRFAKVSNGAYFFPGSAPERDPLLQTFPDFRYEGVAFLRVAAGSGTPVYRFANLSNGGYFYTANEVERDFVLRSRPELRFEGSTFTVADIGTSGGTTASLPRPGRRAQPGLRRFRPIGPPSFGRMVVTAVPTVPCLDGRIQAAWEQVIMVMRTGRSFSLAGNLPTAFRRKEVFWSCPRGRGKDARGRCCGIRAGVCRLWCGRSGF